MSPTNAATLARNILKVDDNQQLQLHPALLLLSLRTVFNTNAWHAICAGLALACHQARQEKDS
jgi:hypothetical protein